jgi:hypothetical protein
LGELSAIPGLKITASDIAKTANDILSSKYGFERVGDYSVELRQKDNPKLQVLKPGSSQQLTLKEALTEIATERRWIETETKKEPIIGKVTPGKDGKLTVDFIPPHLKAIIEKKIAAEK